MALPQIVTKTYSRRRSRQADVSHAERTFDEVFRDATRPPARAAATAEKWGSASFRRICSSTRTSPKRRLSPTSHGDDPFSFDSDDDNIAKKSRKENISQKTSVGAATMKTVGVRDGHYSDDTECTVGEKSRRRMMNLKEKLSADEQQATRHHDARRDKQYNDNMRKCQTAITAKLKSVDCTDSERNGMSAYSMATVRVSGKGDSLEMSDRRCRSNGLESASCCERKPHSATVGRNTRSNETSSRCKSTQQLKVFVDNFSQLISSQRSAANKRLQPNADDQLSAGGKQDSPIKRSKSSQISDSESGHSQLSGLRSGGIARKIYQRASTLKTQTGLSSALRHSKEMCRDSDDDDDDDDDDGDCVVTGTSSPLSQKSNAVHSVSLTRRASDSSRTTPAIQSSDTADSRNSSPVKTSSRLLTANMPVKYTGGSRGRRNDAVGSKLGQMRSHRLRNSDKSTTDSSQDSEQAASTAATVSAASTATTCTRRLLTSSRKVSTLSLHCTVHRAFTTTVGSDGTIQP